MEGYRFLYNLRICCAIVEIIAANSNAMDISSLLTDRRLDNNFLRQLGSTPINQCASLPPGKLSNYANRPNILIFMADDLGHADIGYSEGSHQTPTPNIDKFAYDGIILNRHYSHPLCTPTRSAFMTGKYAFQVGMQTGAISEGEPWGLPVAFKIQPQYFKDLGYSTYTVGKWHLGSHTRNHYPSSRGFDYSFGITSGDCNWYDFTAGWMKPVPVSGRALRENGKIFPLNQSTTPFPELIASRAENLIAASPPNKPWYMFFATPLTHTGFDNFDAVQHPVKEYHLHINESAILKFEERVKQLGSIHALDRTFARLVKALKRKGVLNNTIIIFVADNGAPLPESADFIHGTNHGSNWPLRQGKGTLFEGGIRTLSFIWAPMLQRRGFVYDDLFHISDWLPTLYEGAGGNTADLTGISAVSHWKRFHDYYAIGPVRDEVVNNIDGVTNQYSITIMEDNGKLYKLLGGNVFNNSYLGWRRTEGTSTSDEMKSWTPLSVNCNAPEGVERAPCQPWLTDCLFDITSEPCETNNIASVYPSTLRKLQLRLRALNDTAYPPQILPYDPASNPDLYDGFWVPWKDIHHVLDPTI
ncbi:arylsulfatase B-like [Paramacrobiotus metropolitanus]|uniref:arylsulfatase B-like n=1 Tax=Paramacrobiotus metropolitanus TaxID=2943436 RepID=UPI0024465114|nr:arylsulfatase B-like [Paramacrobiotus metropolitanus]